MSIKKIFVFLLCCSMSEAMDATSITQQQALQQLYATTDTAGVDIYISNAPLAANTPIVTLVDTLYSPEETTWFIFIDEEPKSNWGHNCKYLFIGVETVHYSQYQHMAPPLFDDLLLVKTILGEENEEDDDDLPGPTKRKIKIEINQHPTTIWDNSENNYALILSGGADKKANKKRYWNDCSAMYKILTQVYKYKKENIYTLMADGTSPSKDRCLSPGIYDNSPTDLDGDGTADIQYPATLEAFINVIRKLSQKLQKEDNLLIYVTDHGWGDANKNQYYIIMWNPSPALTSESLASLLAPLSAKGVHINIVMGQCYSGGFIDALKLPNVVISTACKKDKTSVATFGLKHDEYLFRWMAAVNGNASHNTIVNADTNNDGWVSMHEAFRKAKEEDIWDNMLGNSPQYGSTPSDFGDNMTLYGAFPELIGPDILCDSAEYTVTNVPKGSIVKWTYEDYNPLLVVQPLKFSKTGITSMFYRGEQPVHRVVIPSIPLTISASQNDVETQAVMSGIQTEPYVGSKTISATILRNGVSYILTKTITMPDTIRPSITSTQTGIWRAGRERSFVDTTFVNVDENEIHWKAYINDSEFATHVGKTFTVTAPNGFKGVKYMTINVTYDQVCQPYNTNQKTLPIIGRIGILLRQDVLQNITATILYQTDENVSLSTTETEYYDGTYTLELWSDKGIKILSYDKDEPVTNIPIANLSAGQYILKLFIHSIEMDTKQLIIQ